MIVPTRRAGLPNFNQRVCDGIAIRVANNPIDPDDFARCRPGLASNAREVNVFIQLIDDRIKWTFRLSWSHVARHCPFGISRDHR